MSERLSCARFSSIDLGFVFLPAPRVIEPREVTVHLPPEPVVAPSPGAALPTAPVDTTPGAPAAPALPTAGAEVPVVAAPAAPPIDAAPTLPGPSAAADPLAPIAAPVPGTPA